MKHCAKKLLGFAFALALCLAVGGTALAQTPEFAEAPAALPEQEMLAYEPNVTAEPGMKTTGDIATDGYQVTIPTTVEVKSGENKGTLEVKAQLKQYRTLNIGIESNNKWKLAYDDTTAADTPKVDYTLTTDDREDGKAIAYYDDNNTLHYGTGELDSTDPQYDSTTGARKFATNFSVNVPTPSQATMSGTYSDTLTFTFDLVKHCVTYTINVYEQELKLTNSGAHVQAVNVVDASGNVIDTTSVPKETYVLEYGCADANGTPLANAATNETWTRPRPSGTDGEEDTRCWEDLSRTLTPKADFTENVKAQTINLNLVRKWYWLDVNGATDYTNEYADGNQGNKIAGFVNMQVSADNGTNWSSWFWQEPGDDYWGKFPYGIYFKLGFHHVKNGYVYDTGTNGGVKIIANKQETETKPGKKEGDTTYYVYEGTLTGEPTGEDSYKNVRYCYIPCYKKGLTYMANQGTGGKEDVNGANKPRTNVLYQEGYELESPEDLNINPPSADMVFAGWSTKSTYTTGEMLYQPGNDVGSVEWEKYTDTSKRPKLDGKTDDEKRELYAVWGYKTDIKIAFENKWGSTDKDATGVFATVQKRGFEHEKTLKTDEIVIPGQKLTLKMSDPDVTAAIDAATTAVDSSATKDKIWDLEKEYTITVPENSANMPRFEILRKRYLLNVMAVLSTSGNTVALPADAAEAAKYGTFHVKSNGSYQTAGGESKVSVYQWLRNYGGSYEVCEVEANTGYQFVEFMRPAGKGLTSAGTSTNITGTLTGKNENLSYFGGDTTTYEGDTIYVVFKKDVVTFDYNGGTSDGKTELVLNYDDSVRFPKVVLTHPNNVTHIGWSTEKNPDSDDKIFKLASAGDVLPGQTTVSSKVKNWPNPNNKVLYAVWRSTTGPSLAPARKALTLRYHANFDPNEELALDLDPDPLLDDMDDTFGFDPDPLLEDVDDALEGAVKTVSYQPGEDVVLRNCMFKRGGYVFVGWNTEPDGTGRLYRVNGVPITDWAAGDTVDLYAQWKKPDHLKPVVDNEPFVPTDPDTPPEELDPGFGIDPDADPADEEGPADDADAVDDAPAVADEEAAAAPPEELDFGFGIDPDAAVGGPAPFVRW